MLSAHWGIGYTDMATSEAERSDSSSSRETEKYSVDSKETENIEENGDVEEITSFGGSPQNKENTEAANEEETTPGDQGVDAECHSLASSCSLSDYPARKSQSNGKTSFLIYLGY